MTHVHGHVLLIDVVIHVLMIEVWRIIMCVWLMLLLMIDFHGHVACFAWFDDDEHCHEIHVKH